MKTVIPNTRNQRHNVRLSNDIIPVSLVDVRKIIVIDQSESSLGIVTELPSGEYGVIDLYMCNNLWASAVSRSIVEVIDMFHHSGNHIYQFDDRREFIKWMATRENVTL